MLPLLLVRVAGRPYAALEALRPPRTVALIHRLFALPARRRAESAGLSDEIGSLVPGVEASARRRLLELRRAIYSDRSPRLRGRELIDTLTLLPSEIATRVRAWLASREEETATGEEARAALAEELRTTVLPRLHEALDDLDFAASLAHANPALWSALERARRTEPSPAADGPPSPRRPTREELGLAAFLIRAAAKTSPFGRFMHIAACPIRAVAGGTAFTGHSSGRWSRTYADRSLVAAAVGAALIRVASGAPVACMPNPTLRRAGTSRYRMQTNRYVWVNEHLWREQRLSTFRCPAMLADAIEGLPERFTSTEAMDAFIAAGLAREEAAGGVQRLLETGAILVDPWTDCYAEDPLDAALGTLEPLGVTAAPEVFLLSAAREAVARFGARDPRGRRDAIGRLEHMIGELPSGPLAARLQVAEDSFLDSLDGGLSRDTLAHLDALRGELRGHLRVRPEYALIRDRFRERFGSGGRCPDVVTFLLETSAEVAPVLSGLRDAHDVLGAGTGRREPVPEGEKVGVTAVFQVARGPEGEGESLVVNRVYDGTGWLSARTVGTVADREPQRLDELREWLRVAAGGREPVAFPVCGECSSLQRHPRLTDRTLLWPGEPLLAGRTRLDAAHINLVDDPATGRLEFVDAQGRGIQPVTLGGAYPTPAWGARYLVLSIAQPYVIGRPTFTGGDPSPSGVVAYPRISLGGIVLKRASWSLPSELIRSLPRADPVAAMLGALRLFEAEGIPRVVFARGSLPQRLGIADTHIDLRKPLWIDVHNPLCLELLARIARRADHVLVEEMLPDAGGLCVRIDGAPHVAEFQVEMLV